MKNDKKRLTILADRVVDADIIAFFEGRPITDTGLKLIRAAMVLDDADVLDHLTLLIGKKMVEKIGSRETLKKSLDISDMLSSPDSSKTTPAETSRKRVLFGTQ